MVQFGWHGVLMVQKLQRRFRKMRGISRTTPPEADMDDAAVCLFCLTDNIFYDERSIDLFTRAVELKKQCELIVLPKAKWGAQFDMFFWDSWVPFGTLAIFICPVFRMIFQSFRAPPNFRISAYCS